MSQNNSQNKHEIVEKNVGLMAILTVFAISFGALVEITPLMFQEDTTEPVDGLRPLTALEMEGRDIYVREGCYNCHSQMIRLSVTKLSVTVTTLLLVKVCGITHSSGVLSVLVQT